MSNYNSMPNIDMTLTFAHQNRRYYHNHAKVLILVLLTRRFTWVQEYVNAVVVCVDACRLRYPVTNNAAERR